jgi:hypothetical protein
MAQCQQLRRPCGCVSVGRRLRSLYHRWANEWWLVFPSTSGTGAVPGIEQLTVLYDGCDGKQIDVRA